MQLAPGSLITKSVRLERLLGRGGMGSVWIADHLALNVKVAVKVVLDGLQNDAGARARFVLEAQAAAQIRSPHVAQVFDSGLTDDDLPFIIMELLDGEDLDDRIERSGRLELIDVANVVVQACKALSGAHAAGIVHRDIKPSNIFLAKQGDDIVVKVLDFGIAKHLDDASFSVTATGIMLGTPWYMSPEQIVSPKSVAFASDLWSLAAAAYYALTGEPPFSGETLGAVCLAISNGRYKPPSQRQPGLTPAVDAWFARAFAVDPGQRFASAREMANALATLAGLPSSSFATSSPNDAVTVFRQAPLTPYDQVAETIASAPQLPEAAPTPETLDGTSTRTPPQRSSAAIYGVVGAVAMLVLGGLGAGAFWVAQRRPVVTHPASATPDLPSTAAAVAASAAPPATSAGPAIESAATDAAAPRVPSGRAGRGGRGGKTGPTPADEGQVDRGF